MEEQLYMHNPSGALQPMTQITADILKRANSFWTVATESDIKMVKKKGL